MKITKQQLKRIIKEELLNEAVGGGIDEFAKRVGVAPLPPQFTNDELADFARELLKASPAKPKSATKGATGIHPLSLPIDRDDPKSGAGFALEKLIMKRVTKASGKQNQCMQRCKSARDTALSPAEFRRGEGVCTDECDKEWFKRDKEGNVVKDPRTKYAVSIIDDLRAVRDELLDVVDPTGGAKEWRAHATDLRGSDRRKDPMYGYEESKKRVTKSLLKQIIKEEISKVLKEISLSHARPATFSKGSEEAIYPDDQRKMATEILANPNKYDEQKIWHATYIVQGRKIQYEKDEERGFGQKIVQPPWLARGDKDPGPLTTRRL